ncbi:ubiquinone/menaquinone biosynthesis C-methylase UbiE [Natronospira proteinivora]|uniref:Ubiquinone/menaquinone biosynthesis C-methylase UbiE n=1 Tax=Natronospira proteinivora TaxID=1807133 RepID=A0ABT1GBD3_9GAMM|nr:class I SAM-dependent methyltransferase [Natronospira proteinivora]MCP1727583.1 ubiquinone/menaquinone biosynthesis C-methylase UbiE [Natronospira proteinivora]
MDNKALASQLRCPGGRNAVGVAQAMNEANQAINRRCIRALSPQAGERVLEIGQGNGAFADFITGSAPGVDYTGVDWSPTMVAEAARLNRHLLMHHRARFLHASVQQLPLADGQFDSILSVHCLYFWDPLNQALDEIRRVMAPGARLCLAFGERAFMESLAFTAHGFNLPDLQAVCDQLTRRGLQIQRVDDHWETGLSNNGQMVEKHSHILLARV